MRILWRDIAAAIFMGMILPGIMLNAAVLRLDAEEQETVPETVSEEAVRWPVKVRTGETVTKMDMDGYITCVVLAEMPAFFETEALKAQSVAARTYAQKAAVTGGKHGDGSVCTESACCQGYMARAAYLAQGGARESVDKIARAVKETSGCVLTYEGELIDATYFSCSGGSTEDALAVWGTDIPYLQAVSSPGEEQAAAYTQTICFTPEEFQAALGRKLSGSPESWFTITTYTDGGGVAEMTIGGEIYSGTGLRTVLGLRSTAFTVEASPTEIRITTRGFGHRVGMSQYGADAMAASGSSYMQILAHYYPGTELVRMETDESGEVKYG